VTRTRWLMEQVRELAPGEFAQFRRLFLEYDTELWQAEVDERARGRTIDPAVAEALAGYRDSLESTT
jgi:hypothetical protein